ncbi:S-adenosyl-L-methionine-dependent methyltransferase [Chytriomyces sp. MP71]|nr:S-adenosyl-L-methionine-dependent methyltransferase [Chytriomyces sp. MP71]
MRRAFASSPRTQRGNYWDSLAKSSATSQGLLSFLNPEKETESEHSLATNSRTSARRASGLSPQPTYYTESLLAKCASPPTNARLSTRAHIHDSLYNPHYGYFSRNARIFQVESDAGIPFNTLRDAVDFTNHLGTLYEKFELEGAQDESMRQVWHTPTELFKPHYGNAIANYIIQDHLADASATKKPLKIYEIGAGNGTLAKNVLDFLQEHHPDVYVRTQYTIVEISAKLASAQRAKNLARHGRAVHVVNQSIFEYDQVEPDECYFIAMEVIDNFSHDLVRYTQDTAEPVQGVVLVDSDGDYQEAYEALSDPLIQRYLDLRRAWTKRPPGLAHPWLRKLQQSLPFASNLSDAEFLPTMNMLFLEKLHKNFPNHRLLLSDFDALPDAIPGHTAPVVQTRYKGTMVACSTYLVQPGFFDIFFPTDFEALLGMYREIARRYGRGERRALDIMTQRDFLVKNAVGMEGARVKSGEVPMFDFYRNFRFLLTR